ncbi:MAG: TerC/Alx family metal homeostasis membrane protein [Gammaproteobacteria bacterium]|nr:TerC/Alx family metal homeostasis membrane protein [Gammaproteobacteria bacterium]
MISVTALIWISFLLLICLVVALDLGVFHRKAHVVSLPEAVGWTAVWVSLALVFNVGVFYLYELNPGGWDMDTEQLSGRDAALQFFTGYVVEKSLSIDNIFVIAMIFAYLRTPLAEQHRVLFWGIMGAIIMRGVMIFGGLVILERFDWVSYLLGGVLIYSAAKVLIIRHDNVDVANSATLRLVRRVFDVTDDYHGSSFFVRKNGVLMATPLFVALILVETADVMFAIDSIPAIFAITHDPFIVFTSNIFALLGLRSMYFVLSGLMEKFRYLKMSLVFLLAYVGVKMLLIHVYPIPNHVSLMIIGGILGVGMLASTKAGRDTISLLSPLADEMENLMVATYRQARRAVILLIGSSVLVIGVAMVVLPGPAVLVVPLGLAILGIEFAWARRWLTDIRARLDGLTQDVSDRLKNERQE